MFKKLFNRIFKKNHSKNTRFIEKVTSEQIAKVIHNVLNQKELNYDPRLQYRKKKSQSKNWAKWRV